MQLTTLLHFERHIYRLIALLIFSIMMASCASTAPRLGERGYTEEGKASYYGRKFQGRKMANGEPYRRNKMTAAHKTLPFGTRVEVTNLQNKKKVKVEITDRGPFIRGRIIDLSEAAARRLNFIDAGVVPVKMKVIEKSQKK